ncbi:hypothetical protein DY000_02009858 [Brassica cretica]|uniref:DUF4005 domain-containing protein n=1 Tax=Brassica cretica TaxID=69181 RepID=A0ABQ7BU50_BRACR|nr:hypothetical protein DY000_02009858 [Brassica cretica]
MRRKQVSAVRPLLPQSVHTAPCWKLPPAWLYNKFVHHRLQLRDSGRAPHEHDVSIDGWKQHRIKEDWNRASPHNSETPGSSAVASETAFLYNERRSPELPGGEADTGEEEQDEAEVYRRQRRSWTTSVGSETQICLPTPEKLTRTGPSTFNLYPEPHHCSRGSHGPREFDFRSDERRRGKYRAYSISVGRKRVSRREGGGTSAKK